MSADPKKFYLTTPIYYVNARPHIGHAYTTIVADVLARRHRLLGDETFFLTGTDEHGQKIERSAAAAGVPPQQFTDQVAQEFKTLWDRMGITYDKFIRTTDPAHKLGVQKLWRELESRGFIYLSSYTGAYCVSDEAFVDAPAGTPCPDCGRLLETVTEENYFFKLSAFQLPLLDLIESNKLIIENESRRNEVLSFLRGNLTEINNLAIETGDSLPHIPGESPKQFLTRVQQTVSSHPDFIRLEKEGKIARTASGEHYVPGTLKDLSISRSSFKWGIPVPGNDKHVTYVWLDALANYITALGYGSDDESLFEKFWLTQSEDSPLHLVGKEIIRFHCVYWPAFLLAAGLPIPKAITAHGWLLFDNSKMSKSKGNIVRTETILDAFGTLCPSLLSFRSAAEESASPAEPTKHDRDLFASDVLRYFLLREIPFGQDGSFSFDALLTRYNADLANGYGNLVSRTLKLIEKGLSSEIRTIHKGGFSFLEVDESDEDDLDTPYDWTLGMAGHELDEIWRMSPTLEQTVGEHFLNKRFAQGTVAIWQAIAQVDQYLSEFTPWKLIGSSQIGDFETLDKILYTAAESIRNITALLHPIMPYATSRVWTQLGLGDIELAAKNGELKNLQWGGLKPGTKLGPLSPIFPRADKSLIEIMNNMENESTPPSKPSLGSATTPAPVAAETADPTHPAAGPRPLNEPSNTPLVAGTTALNAAHAPVPEASPAHAPSQTAPAPEVASQISIDDFAKIELRVAQIVVAERIPKADKLLRLEVDLGPDFPRRQILSGIAEHYTPEELIGRRIVVITNLAPRKMRGLESHGMLLAASAGENGKPILATFAEDIALGSRLK